ncbi:MAG: phosphatidylglycerophosphatase A [Halobacteriovoraceae bacterium]|nr:phosphatidylglycerophosphatase A [Halobacteriovoraceae bacterium]
MAQIQSKILSFLEKSFLSFLGVGLAPFAPGTFGTLAICPFLYFFDKLHIPTFIFLPILILATFLSCILAERNRKKNNEHDPSWIVIDEVLGMSLSWIIVGSTNLVGLIILFILFRLFDIFKIGPAKYFDTKVTHGCGVILDDLVSGVYASLIFLILRFFLSDSLII